MSEGPDRLHDVRQRILRNKPLLRAGALLLPVWATLFVCALKHHPSLYTPAFHACNAALILSVFLLGRSSRGTTSKRPPAGSAASSAPFEQDVNPRLLAKAAFNGDLRRIEQLLTAGADIEVPGDNWTPLHAAIENWQLPAVRLLLDRGADVNGTFEGWTALAHALNLEMDKASNTSGPPFKPPTPELSAVLIEHGADPNRPMPDGRTFLQWLSERNYPKGLEMLLAARDR